MTNIFKKIEKNTSSFIIFAWPLGIVLLCFACVLMYEDYATSKAGYEMLPTAKVNQDWIPFIVAALPQVGQIVLFFIFGRDTKKSWAGILAFAFFAVDISTDVWFKSNQDYWLFPIAFIESLFIFTLGSEVLFTIALGFITESFAEFMIVFGVFIKSTMDGINGMLETVGIGDDSNTRK